MCQDEPSWEVLFGMLRGMYKKHPVRIDIAGTVESISHITAELLYKCYGHLLQSFEYGALRCRQC